MFELSRFGLSDLLECTSGLRVCRESAASMEQVADRVVSYLHEHLVDKSIGERSCALVRLYKTHPLGALPPEQQTFAHGAGEGLVDANTPCLTLLGTAGDLPEWNDRRRSRAHQAIPVGSGEALNELPMVSQLLAQIGVSPADLGGDGDLDQRSYDVFYVPAALDSPLIPAQDDFVVPHGINSVLGFGAGMPSGSFFAVILFSRTPIPQATAELFSAVGLSVKLALLPFDAGPVFDGDRPPDVEVPVERLRSEVATLEQLVSVRSDSVRDLAVDLEQALQAEQEKTDELTRSRHELAEAEGRLRAMLESSLDAVISMDHRGRILEFNGAAESVFGYARADVVGRLVADLLVPPALRDRHRRGLEHYLETGEGRVLNRRIEITALRSDGSEFPVELAINRVDVPGDPIFTGYLRDISERHAVERRLLQGSQHLAQLARTLQSSLLPPGTGPPASAATSEASSTTCSRSPRATGRSSSATCSARVRRRPP